MNKLSTPHNEASVDIGVGNEIRKLRKARGKSLSELALAIGRSISFISQLERGAAEPSISDLKGIAQTLGVPVGWFFLSDDIPMAERSRVVRAEARKRLGASTDGLIEELLSPDIGGAFEIFLSTIAPGTQLTTPTTRDTEEEGYLVKGSLDLWISNHHFTLKVGDSFRIVREPFRWANLGETDAVVVWTIAPPIY